MLFSRRSSLAHYPQLQYCTYANSSSCSRPTKHFFVMERLRSDFLKAMSKNQNADSPTLQFLVETDIDELLTAPRIKECIQESGIDPVKQDECFDRIYTSGHKVFAVLVLIRRVSLLPNFVQTDQMNKEPALDSKLPFSLEDLTLKFGDKGAAMEFEDQQWRVAIPFLRQDLAYRTFHQKTILPFTKKESLVSGGFGEVDVVTVAAGQHALGSTHSGEVRF